ncbi:MAG: septum formation protein Maf [Deltaproteobacteria bacterium]|nr:septum formation protein Maf [Deltaproteobacteria bacterium]
MPESNSLAAPPECTRLVLASASPKRARILGDAGLLFDVQVSSIEEASRAGEGPADLAERLAREKALDVAGRIDADRPRPVLGSDTIVVSGRDRVLGKPRDAAHAVELLARLVGTTHRVMTGIALAWSDERPILSRVVSSEVSMRSATREELVAYVAVGESLDKAGGYALQGEGGRRFVVEVRGSQSNVIGLPLEETLALLEAGGVATNRFEPERA